MNRRIPLLLLCLVLLCSCTPFSASPAMYIEPAQLNQQEAAIAKLLGAGSDHLLFDFKTDERVQSARVQVYELLDGAWEPLQGDGFAWTGKQGRLALGFEVVPDSLRVAIQHGEHYSATTYTASERLDTANTSRSTVRLAGRTELSYNQEVPLVIQTFTDRAEHRSYAPESYFTPEVFASGGFTHVYAITLRFSQQPLE